MCTHILGKLLIACLHTIFSYKPLCLINKKPFSVTFSVLFLKAYPMLYSLRIYSDPILHTELLISSLVFYEACRYSIYWLQK